MTLRYATIYFLTRDDEELELEIEYDIEDFIPAQTYGPPEDCYPAEGGGVTDFRAFYNGKPFELTASEEKDLISWLEETHDFSEDDYEDYYDAER